MRRCISRARPRAPSSFTGAACHRINIALHNPASVSARLDPLPHERSVRSLWLERELPNPSERFVFFIILLVRVSRNVHRRYRCWWTQR